jgi:hypothetical protein
VMSRNLLPDFSGGLIASGLNRGIPLLAGASTIIAFVALALAAPVFAQTSLDSSSAPPTDYAVPPPSDGSLVEPSIPGDTAADDMDSDDDGDTASSNAAAPAPHVSAKSAAVPARGSAATATHSGWNRVSDVDEDTPDSAQSDKVLEVPQVLPPVNSQPSVNADETTPDGGNDGNQLADQSPPPEQVGSIDDYQDEEESAIVGVFVVPVPLGAVGISPYGMNVFQSGPLSPGFGSGFVPGFTPFVPSTTALRPFGGGMNSAIMPTSPMFPRSRIFSGGFMAPRGAMHFSGGGFGRGR